MSAPWRTSRPSSTRTTCPKVETSLFLPCGGWLRRCWRAARAADPQLAPGLDADRLRPGAATRSDFPPFDQAVGGVVVMASLASCVRITARQSAFWRECAGCTGLAPLAPDETHCPACKADSQARTARRRTARAA
jgi:hypothetical protein